MVVTPEASASSAPRRALHRYSSGVSEALTSIRLMIQSPNCWSSNMPRKLVYSRWLWALTNPGITTARPKSTSTASGQAARTSLSVPTATMRSPSTATAPFRTGGAVMGSSHSAR